MVTPLLILLFFWIAIQTAADSLSEAIGETVLSRSQAREAMRPLQPSDDHARTGDEGSKSADSAEDLAGPSLQTEAGASEIAADEAARTIADAQEQRQLKFPKASPAAQQRANPARTRVPARAMPPDRSRIPTRPPAPAPTQPDEPSPTPLANLENLEKIQEVSDLIGSPSPESRNDLIGMLRDDDPMLRVLAAHGLSSYEDDHILRLITAAANRETDPAAKRDLDQIVAGLRRR